MQHQIKGHDHESCAVRGLMSHISNCSCQQMYNRVIQQWPCINKPNESRRYSFQFLRLMVFFICFLFIFFFLLLISFLLLDFWNYLKRSHITQLIFTENLCTVAFCCSYSAFHSFAVFTYQSWIPPKMTTKWMFSSLSSSFSLYSCIQNRKIMDSAME